MNVQWRCDDFVTDQCGSFSRWLPGQWSPAGHVADEPLRSPATAAEIQSGRLSRRGEIVYVCLRNRRYTG